MCNCSFQGFFSYGGFLIMLMGTMCVMIVGACPSYEKMCNGGRWLLIFMCLFCFLQCCVMISIGHSLALVEKLTLDQLAPENITKSTKRWGWVAKNFPTCSRCNHIIIGVIAGIGLLAGIFGCSTGDGNADECQQPLGAADPLRDFAVLFALWALLAFSGCRSQKKNTSLPHIYEPTPATRTERVGQACSVLKLCHP